MHFVELEAGVNHFFSQKNPIATSQFRMVGWKLVLFVILCKKGLFIAVQGCYTIAVLNFLRVALHKACLLKTRYREYFKKRNEVPAYFFLFCKQNDELNTISDFKLRFFRWWQKRMLKWEKTGCSLACLHMFSLHCSTARCEGCCGSRDVRYKWCTCTV